MFHLPSTTKEGLPRECSLATLQRKLNLKLWQLFKSSRIHNQKQQQESMRSENPEPETTARKQA
jgi:hypothetical protein